MTTVTSEGRPRHKCSRLSSGINDDARRDVSASLITRIGPSRLIVAAQVAGELYNVLTKKAGGREVRQPGP